ncbi:MAG: carbohydrate kinase family protein [Anaerolineae bacterium]
MADDDDMFDVMCYGTISVENVTRLAYLPTPRRDVPALSEHDELGGEALKVAIPLAAWGLRVVVAGNFIGIDRKSEFIMSELAHYPRIDTRYIQQYASVVTPFSRVLVTPDGERSRIAYWYDQTPKAELTPLMMQQARILSVDAYGRDERDRAAGVARELRRTVISADAIWLQYPLAGLSDVVIISNAWLQTNFPGAYEYDHALDLQQRGAGVVIVTDGARPVLVVRADGAPFGVEPYELERVVDTSGAGDLFKAGITYAWLQPKWSLEYKVKFACAAAGLNCARDRSIEPPPSLDEIFALMHAQPR